MTRKPIHINEDDSIPFVVSIFERTHISGALVVNEKGDYVGVISKTDLVSSRLLKQAGQIEALKARDFTCYKPPITISPEAPLQRAVEMMLEHQVHRLFVADAGGKIVGVLSSFDIMRAIRPGAQENPSAQPKATAAEDRKPEKAAPAGDKSDKKKKFEQRIFSLISQKQEQIYQHK